MKLGNYKTYLDELRVFMVMVATDAGTSKMVNCSDLVGVKTVAVQPCQELLSNLTKLFWPPDLLFDCGGGSGTTNPSLMTTGGTLFKSSDSKSSPSSLTVVGVSTSTSLVLAVSPLAMREPRLEDVDF